MPASLTKQVRLGYSMGWRIWTPNEVGFYAKTLSHSYFILIILKSKFLSNKLWIVNYNLFMGVRKYYIFVEFLKFGAKTKEERSYWKKVLHVSLLVRHPKFTTRYKKREVKIGFKFKSMKRHLKIRVLHNKRYRWWRAYKNKKLLSKIFKGFKKKEPKFLKIAVLKAKSIAGVSEFIKKKNTQYRKNF